MTVAKLNTSDTAIDGRRHKEVVLKVQQMPVFSQTPSQLIFKFCMWGGIPDVFLSFEFQKDQSQQLLPRP